MKTILGLSFLSKFRRVYLTICPIWFLTVLVFLSFSETAFSSKLCTQIAIEPKELPEEVEGTWESTTTQDSLNGHIARVHFDAWDIYAFGLPQWDLEVARLRGFKIEWVLKKIYEKIERTNADIELEISNKKITQLHRPNAIRVSDFNSEFYRLHLVKTIHLMVDLGLFSFESVDWARVNAAYPNAATVTYSLETDVRGDGSFFEHYGLDPKTYYKVFRP